MVTIECSRMLQIFMLFVKYLVIFHVNDIKQKHREGTVFINLFTNNSWGIRHILL